MQRIGGGITLSASALPVTVVAAACGDDPGSDQGDTAGGGDKDQRTTTTVTTPSTVCELVDVAPLVGTALASEVGS